MKILLPDGYELPDNARPGEAFEAVATIRPSDDGSFMLVAIDGMEMAADEEAPSAEEEAEELSEAQKFATKVPMPWDKADVEY